MRQFWKFSSSSKNILPGIFLLKMAENLLLKEETMSFFWIRNLLTVMLIEFKWPKAFKTCSKKFYKLAPVSFNSKHSNSILFFRMCNIFFLSKALSVAVFPVSYKAFLCCFKTSWTEECMSVRQVRGWVVEIECSFFVFLLSGWVQFLWEHIKQW